MSTTVVSTHTVWCDGPGCRMYVRSSKSRADARSKAARLGWKVNHAKYSRTSGEDYCTSHYEWDAEELSTASSTKRKD